ncbi:MAG: DUF1801 domain-containing protein [Balneolaceae bacterium]|nr:DUF1801 domain-containing protein [Balneolaceae bacterium]
MSELKTKRHAGDVQVYLDGIKDPQRKKDCIALHQLMQSVTGKKDAMWGKSIVGYGSYHYTYKSGREGDWMLTGFSNRKKAISIYITSGFKPFEELLKKLGTHKTAKSCLYIKSLDDINREVLKELIQSSIRIIQERYREEN